ncbi:MAG: S1 RNA-binding domain-containing protein [Anaerolineales bacterium]
MSETKQYNSRRSGSNTSEPDDGWWQSLMSEEFKYAPVSKARPERKINRRPSQAKENKAPAMDWVDWRRVLEIQEAEAVCYAEVVGYNRGGLLVRTQEFQGFVPRSHLTAAVDGRKITEHLLEGYLGKEIELKVIECDPERGRIVLSERAAQSAPGTRQTLLQTLRTNQELEGVVTNVTPFGLFIDLGGVEGLVHISELSWGRVAHPRQIANPGDKVKVVVLQLEMDRGRVSLSIKRGQPNPWKTAIERYPIGAEVQAEITEVVHFGAFVRLEQGLEGLIHISQMGLHERLDPRLVLEPGIKVQVSILQVEPERQRLSLQLLSHPWKEADSQGPNWLDTPGEHG